MDLQALKDRLERAKGIKVEVSPDAREAAELLLALENEAERIKLETASVNETERRAAQYEVRTRLDAKGDTHVIVDSFVIAGIGVFVVRAPSGAEQRTMLEGVKGKNPDAAEASFACAVTMYPEQAVVQKLLTDSPLVGKTIVNLAMELGGLRQVSELRKSG